MSSKAGANSLAVRLMLEWLMRNGILPLRRRSRHGAFVYVPGLHWLPTNGSLFAGARARSDLGKRVSVPLVLTATLLLIPSQLSAQAPPPTQTNQRPPADLCDTPEHHQFDFWVGEWAVYRSATNEMIARSLIEKLYNACAIRENWMPVDGGGGGSLNSYRPDEKRWRQFWTDSANSLHEYVGQIESGAMVLTGSSRDHAGTRALQRMTFTPKPDGEVVQKGEKSTDEGKTWQLEYELIYRPAEVAGEKG